MGGSGRFSAPVTSWHHAEETFQQAGPLAVRNGRPTMGEPHLFIVQVGGTARAPLHRAPLAHASRGRGRVAGCGDGCFRDSPPCTGDHGFAAVVAGFASRRSVDTGFLRGGRKHGGRIHLVAPGQNRGRSGAGTLCARPPSGTHHTLGAASSYPLCFSSRDLAAPHSSLAVSAGCGSAWRLVAALSAGVWRGTHVALWPGCLAGCGLWPPRDPPL